MCGQLAGSRPRLPSLGGERSGCAGIAPLERRPLGVERCPQSFLGCWAGWPWSCAPPAGLHLSQSDRPAAPVWGAAADLAPATTWPLPQPAGTERTRGGSSRPVRRLPGSTRCSCLVLEFRRRPRARGPHPGRWLRSLRRYSRVARSRRGSEGVHEPTAS